MQITGEMCRLNDISFLGDMGHKDRCTHLRHSFTHLNRGQGLGFVVFGVVIDKRKLATIIGSLVSVAGTVITTLYSIGYHH